MKTQWQTIADILNKDGVVIIPTDTLYGIVGRAFSKKAVERIYKIKGREKGKPCIVLITSFRELEQLGVQKMTPLNQWYLLLKKIWPGAVSVVLPSSSAKWRYLHRGTGGIAFRMVGKKNRNLYDLLQQTGPLVAPSANPQGLAPARTVKEAEMYFKNKVDAYIDGKLNDKSPSTLVSLLGSKPKILRQGSVDIYK